MKLTRRFIFILILLAVFLIILFFAKNQRIYSFSDVNGEPSDFFTELQLKDLERSNAVLALSIGGILYNKKESINFHIFSKKDFSIFKPKSFVIIYDGKKKGN